MLSAVVGRGSTSGWGRWWLTFTLIDDVIDAREIAVATLASGTVETKCLMLAVISQAAVGSTRSVANMPGR